jgi:hypothetical protein
MHLLVWIHLLLYHHTPNSSTARSQHHQHLYHLDPSTTLSDPSTMQTHMPPKAWHHPDSSTTQISVSTITKYHLGPTLSRTQNHSNPSTILTPASPKSQHHPDPSITQIPAPSRPQHHPNPSTNPSSRSVPSLSVPNCCSVFLFCFLRGSEYCLCLMHSAI